MQINEIIMEIVSLNSKGMSIHDMQTTYAVSHLDGAGLTALGLMCVLYAAFREIDEPVNIGFDFAEEYESALMLADDYGRLGTFM